MKVGRWLKKKNLQVRRIKVTTKINKVIRKRLKKTLNKNIKQKC